MSTLVANSHADIVGQRLALFSDLLQTQREHTQTGAVDTGSTVIPLDTSIPQIGEGDDYMTLSITPTDALHKLVIEAKGFFTSLAANWVTMALFQDANADAIASDAEYQNIPGGAINCHIRHEMVAGTASAITFTIRAGRDASAGSTITFNGVGGAVRQGGTLRSYLTITEYAP